MQSSQKARAHQVMTLAAALSDRAFIHKPATAAKTPDTAAVERLAKAQAKRQRRQAKRLADARKTHHTT